MVKLPQTPPLPTATSKISDDSSTSTEYRSTNYDDTTVMPEFFFHITIELFAHISPTLKQEDQALLVWPGGTQTLSPFLSSKGRRHPQNRSNDTLRASPPSECVLAHSLQRGELRERVGPSNETETNFTPFTTPASDDKRLDHVLIESTNTWSKNSKKNKMNGDNQINKGIGSSANGTSTKGTYEPLDQQTSDSVWGIVHLYRDEAETPGLYGDSLLSKPSNPWYSRAIKDEKSTFHPSAADEDCTTLCILAVPSYLAPPDFLGFVGEETREQVSHFRMIKTARANRYMVLMKFRDGKRARHWQKAWNGKVFNSMEVRRPSGKIVILQLD
jgi:BRCA1-associated protein